MRWAVKHGSDDPEIIEWQKKYMLAWKLRLKPWDVARMDCTDVDAFLIMLKRVLELQGGEKDITDMMEGWS